MAQHRHELDKKKKPAPNRVERRAGEGGDGVTGDGVRSRSVASNRAVSPSRWRNRYRVPPYDPFGGIETISLAVLTYDRTPGETAEFRRERDGRLRSVSASTACCPGIKRNGAAAPPTTPLPSSPWPSWPCTSGQASPERKAYKAGVISLLYRYGNERDTARKLLRFIDWLICLPPLEFALRQELAELEKQSKMSYLKNWERLARQEAEARTLLRQMQLKFGPLAPYLATQVQAAEPAQLEVWLDLVLTATGQREVFTPYCRRRVRSCIVTFGSMKTTSGAVRSRLPQQRTAPVNQQHRPRRPCRRLW